MLCSERIVHTLLFCAHFQMNAVRRKSHIRMGYLLSRPPSPHFRNVIHSFISHEDCVV